MYVITKFTATRIILEDVEVLENIGTIKINVSRYGDLSVRSEAVLTSRPTTPVQAGKIFVLSVYTQKKTSVDTNLPDSNDYVVFNPINLVFLGGNTQERHATFEIEIIDDVIREDRLESFEIIIEATRNLYIPFPVMTVTIIDDEGVYAYMHVFTYNIIIGFQRVKCDITSSAVCTELSNPNNGEVNLTGLTNGSTATYTCARGYYLTGDETRTCLSTEVWSGQEPSCLRMKNYFSFALKF